MQIENRDIALKQCATRGHDKCYATIVKASLPPIRPWVCRRCGVRGEERMSSHDYHEYDRLTKQQEDNS